MKKLLLGLIITVTAITSSGFNALAADNVPALSTPNNGASTAIDSALEADIEDLRGFYREWLEAEREFLNEVNNENLELKDLRDNLVAIESKIESLTGSDLESSLKEIDNDFNAYQSALESNSELGLILIETPAEMKTFYQDLLQGEETMYSELRDAEIKTADLETDLAKIRALVNALSTENSDWSDPLYEKIDTALDNYYQKLDDFFVANFETSETEGGTVDSTEL